MPFLTDISHHNTLKFQLSKSFCSSFRFNPRNLERPWYGLWCQILTDLVDKFDNMIVVPQFNLWVLPDEEDSDSEDEGDAGARTVGDDSVDELDLFLPVRDGDEADEPAVEECEDEVGNTTTDSVRTMPDGAAANLFPDFAIIHLLARRLPPSHSRFLQLHGLQIVHECCPVLLEIKRSPKRSLTGEQLTQVVLITLMEARQDLGIQCHYLFKRYPHAMTTVAIAASGDFWTYKLVHRHEAPPGVGDLIDTLNWSLMAWPNYASLGSALSDKRLHDIHQILEAKKPLDFDL